jgi:hypothetical protein
MEPNVQAFRESAERYCAAIESLPKLPREQTIALALAVVAEMFCYAIRIPDARSLSGLDWPDLVGTDDCATLRRKLEDVFSDKNWYWMVFDPLKSPPEVPVAGSLADDLADIWFDVKRGLLTFEANGEAALADVQWSWKFPFETHWGRHVTGAMAALRELSYQ